MYYKKYHSKEKWVTCKFLNLVVRTNHVDNFLNTHLLTWADPHHQAGSLGLGCDACWDVGQSKEVSAPTVTGLQD